MQRAGTRLRAPARSRLRHARTHHTRPRSPRRKPLFKTARCECRFAPRRFTLSFTLSFAATHRLWRLGLRCAAASALPTAVSPACVLSEPPVASACAPLATVTTVTTTSAAALTDLPRLASIGRVYTRRRRIGDSCQKHPSRTDVTRHNETHGAFLAQLPHRSCHIYRASHVIACPLCGHEYQGHRDSAVDGGAARTLA